MTTIGLTSTEVTEKDGTERIVVSFDIANEIRHIDLAECTFIHGSHVKFSPYVPREVILPFGATHEQMYAVVRVEGLHITKSWLEEDPYGDADLSRPTPLDSTTPICPWYEKHLDTKFPVPLVEIHTETHSLLVPYNLLVPV